METIYLETSFISYLVALPSRDLIIAAHQQITSDWWNTKRNQFECFVSQFVLDEISLGDSNEVHKRNEITKTLKVLEVTKEVEQLTAAIVSSGIIPQKAQNDAAHIAVATIHDVDYILTWNCKHLANAHILKKVRTVCMDNGYTAPEVCTPEVLMEDIDHGRSNR